jgi:hypothetical protein
MNANTPQKTDFPQAPNSILFAIMPHCARASPGRTASIKTIGVVFVGQVVVSIFLLCYLLRLLRLP